MTSFYLKTTHGSKFECEIVSRRVAYHMIKMSEKNLLKNKLYKYEDPIIFSDGIAIIGFYPASGRHVVVSTSFPRKKTNRL